MATSEGGARAALLLLELGKVGSSGTTLMELAKALNQTKPTLLRTISSLIDHGFVEQIIRGRYRLGPSIYSLARAESAVMLDVASWRPVVEDLADTLGQTIYLTRRAGLDIVVIDMQVGSAPVQALTTGIGGRLPMGIGSGSLAILATLDPHDQEVLIAANAHRYSQWNLEPAAVAEIVKKAMVNGYANDAGLIIPETGGIGVPIREQGRYVASMSIVLSAPIQFFSQNNIPEVAKHIKTAIATNLSAHRTK
ncbi:IclR family transcriptional regulator [Agrobacterium tumefaciens]|uniref:IclR family transcriptional regulator n=1 Tax=Agrobacterium tumefaciens TaxID=358 RepID=UPI00220DB86F|nr:hypothetical protein FY157_14020 [Agrobacterium tumefaciens]